MMKSFYYNILRVQWSAVQCNVHWSVVQWNVQWSAVPCFQCRLLSTKTYSRKKKIISFNDKKKADEIADLILKNRKYENSVFIETNPGEGVLTKALLKRKVEIKRYVCFEERQNYAESLNEYGKKKRNDILTVKYIKNFSRILYDTQEEEVLKTANEKTNINSMTFIGLIPQDYTDVTFHNLFDKLKAEDSIFQSISPEYFYFSPPQLYRKIMNIRLENKKSSEYKALAVMLDIFFDFNCIAEIPFTSFSPVIPKQKKAFRETRFEDTVITGDTEYLLHMVPRLDVIREVDNHTNLKFFLKQILQAPKERIIPKMENWMTDSGLHLIRMGISMLDRFIDMNPQQLLQIYKDMQTWPGYEQSFFYSMFNQLHDDSIQDVKTKSLIAHEGGSSELIAAHEDESSELMTWKDEMEEHHGDDEGDLDPV